MGERSPITPLARSPFLSCVERESGQRIMDCYQCGKCTAGCPAAFAVELTPRQIMRGLQLGLKEEVLNSSMIWLCLSCQTCTVRCPCEIDIARVMETLRLMAVRGKLVREREVDVFHRVFLRSVRNGGRLWELGLGGMYNLLSGHPFSNMKLVLALLRKGKLGLLPPRSKAAPPVREIFTRAARLEQDGAQ
jgi:heterodisulfide reductase subunit C